MTENKIREQHILNRLEEIEQAKEDILELERYVESLKDNICDNVNPDELIPLSSENLDEGIVVIGINDDGYYCRIVQEVLSTDETNLFKAFIDNTGCRLGFHKMYVLK